MKFIEGKSVDDYLTAMHAAATKYLAGQDSDGKRKKIHSLDTGVDIEVSLPSGDGKQRGEALKNFAETIRQSSPENKIAQAAALTKSLLDSSSKELKEMVCQAVCNTLEIENQDIKRKVIQHSETGETIYSKQPDYVATISTYLTNYQKSLQSGEPGKTAEGALFHEKLISYSEKINPPNILQRAWSSLFGGKKPDPGSAAAAAKAKEEGEEMHPPAK